MMLMTLNTDSRSISPMTPSPSREMRGIRLFRAISRKLARRGGVNHQDDYEDDSRSSSTDSSGKGNSSSGESGFRSVSPHHMSSSSSETGSDKVRHHLSTSAESIRRVFQNLSINARSKSCTNTKESKRKAAKKSPPKKILRAPVTYTYVKGMSGLPTQRVPKTTTKIYLNNCGGCSLQYMAALHR